MSTTDDDDADVPIELPDDVAAHLRDEETARWYAQPIRPAHGKWIWPIMALGVVFLGASVAALDEIVRAILEGTLAQQILGALIGGLALAFVAFSSLLVAWPALAFRRMRATHVVVTDQRVLEVRARARKPAKVRSWDLAECGDVQRGMPRGASSSLVLQERVRERATDGKTIYEWTALHGLPHVEDAVTILRQLRGDPPLDSSSSD